MSMQWNPNVPDDPARVASPDYLDPIELDSIDVAEAVDEAIAEADHATLTDWLTEGCFCPGLPIRHDWGIMAALRQAAISERDDDALALAKLLVQAIREQVRDGLEAKS